MTNEQILIKEEREYDYYKKEKEYEMTKGKKNDFEWKRGEK